jgi:hypothetical protein
MSPTPNQQQYPPEYKNFGKKKKEKKKKNDIFRKKITHVEIFSVFIYLVFYTYFCIFEG